MSIDPGTQRLRDALAMLAPGTELREGLERILRGRTGALIVLGHDDVVERIASGGFTIDVPFTATGLRELAKMDGAITVSDDLKRIVLAAVHLMPDQSIQSAETGTRHRTADRVSVQTGLTVVSVSQSMQTIAAYIDGKRHVLEGSDQILARANQALATLERYKQRLDEVADTLSALEVEDLVTVRDVAVMAQRQEMVARIATEIETYVLQLGSDGRLLSLQLEELFAGVASQRELLIRDYARPAPPSSQDEVANLLKRFGELSATEILDTNQIAGVLGLPIDDHLQAPVSPRGYRILAEIPRLKPATADGLVASFGRLQPLLSATTEELRGAVTMSESEARMVRDSLSRLAESLILDRFN